MYYLKTNRDNEVKLDNLSVSLCKVRIHNETKGEWCRIGWFQDKGNFGWSSTGSLSKDDLLTVIQYANLFFDGFIRSWLALLLVGFGTTTVPGIGIKDVPNHGGARYFRFNPRQLP